MKINKEMMEEKEAIFFSNLEKEWQNSQEWFSDKELIEIFKPSKKMIASKISDWQNIAQKEERIIVKKLREIARKDLKSFNKWFLESIVRHFYFSKYEKHLAYINKLERMQIFLLGPSKKQFKDLEKIELARNYPIYELASQYLDLKQSGNKYLSLCPFHNEKTPSFYIYPETNTFYCFGCQESGDVITLAMHLYSTDFNKTINLLT